VFAARQQRAEALAEHGFAADRDRIQRGAMKRIPHGNELESAGGNAREFEGHADGGCSARSEQRTLQIARRDFAETFGELDGRLARVTARAKAEFIELPFDGGDDAGMRKADLMNVVAVKSRYRRPSTSSIHAPSAFARALRHGVERD